MKQPARSSFVRFGRAVRLYAPVQRAPQIALDAPLNIVGDEQVQLSVAIVIQPRGAGAETGVPDSRCRGHVLELAAALVVKEMISSERGDINILASIVVIVGHRHTDAVNFHIQTAALCDVGEGPVMIVAVERRGGMPPAGRPVFPVDAKNRSE